MRMNTAKQSTKQNTKENNQETKLREEKNWIIEEHFVKPQHLDQSKRLLWHKPINSTKDSLESSKDRRLRSIHIVPCNFKWLLQGHVIH